MREFRQSGENITALFHHERQMQDPVLIDLLNYWERLRADQIAPLRSEIDPREIRDTLDVTFILERTKLGEIRFRLAGNKLGNLLGMELRGMPAYALIDPASRDEFSGILSEILTDPKIIHLQLISRSEGHGRTKAQMLLLPMRNDTGEINRILGCVSSIDGRTKPPCRFAIIGKKITRIVSSQSLLKEPVVDGFAEDQQTFSPLPAPPKPTEPTGLHSIDGGRTLEPNRDRKSRPHLRLVTDD